jgi:dsDNA-specific endonuclease/ATPase MutS2
MKEEPVEIEVTSVFDLHGFQPKEVALATRTYLEEARKMNFPFVRIIHGRGVGVQRDIVRKILAQSDFVKSFKDAPNKAGGWGATVVKMKKLN